MGEIGETQTPITTERPIVPDISEHAKIVEAATRRYKSFRATVTFEKFPKEELDKLHSYMVGLQTVGEHLGRLKTVISSDKMPELEKRDMRRAYRDTREVTDPITEGIIELGGKEKVDHWPLHDLNNKIEDAEEPFRWLEQVVALGEVIIETRDQNQDERLIRQRIGQEAWEELLNAFGWKKIHNAAESGMEVSLEGALEEEKAEFAMALRRNPWGERQTEKNRKIYQGIRKRIGRTEEGIEILKHLKIVWDCARGSMPEGISAVDILNSSETALQSLDEEGAFEWDPEELEEEGEEEEVEE